MVANLFPRQLDKTYITSMKTLDRTAFDQFVGDRISWIELWNPL